MEDPIFMSDHTHEISSLERCIARCTDDRVRWLLEDWRNVLQNREIQEQHADEGTHGATEMAEFELWIASKYPTPESAKMKCAEATLAMVRDFPSLVRVRGHVMINGVERSHWWCESRDGWTIDPTAHQWDPRPGMYRKWEEGSEEPHGKCINCGNLLFRGNGADSNFCQECRMDDDHWKGRKSIWPCSYCQAADIIDAEARCVDGANCSAQQEMEKE